MKGTKMRPQKAIPAILFLILTVLLVACGEATATSGPAAQPTNPVPEATASTPTATTATGTVVNTTPAATTATTTTSPVTTAPATNKPVTTAPGTTAAKTTAPATTTAAPSPTPGQPGPVSLGQPFVLKVGQSVTLAEASMTLTFAEISEDSRCPDANPATGKSVACFWSGQVTANIEVNMNNGQTGQTVKLTLPASVNTKTTSKAKVGDYQVEVKQILPRRVIDVDIAPGDYFITLVVTK